VNEIPLQPQSEVAVADRLDKLVHLALPVRLTHMAHGGRGDLEMACTYDIHPKGARLLSFRDVKVGDLVTVERGRNKSVCQVVWTADPKSALRGQFTVECMEGNRSPWEDELRQMQETYLPIDSGGEKKTVGRSGGGKQNRRRAPRFEVQGDADLLHVEGKGRTEGRLQQLSEFGCMINSSDVISPGTGLRMVLNIYDVSVALKGNVRYTAENRSMGVEFREIRQGDRPLLDYVLSQLKRPRGGDFADLEVVTESIVAVAG
jgi:hypothetical protein